MGNNKALLGRVTREAHVIEDQNCPICKHPKKSRTSGRLTQWIVACDCDSRYVEKGASPPGSVDFCRDCGKRIGQGRPGSFTQFVFRFDTCQCPQPRPVARVPESAESGNSYYVEDSEDELAFEAGYFPKERYKALSKLGIGAGGAVFLARDRLLDKLVAVKVLHRLEPRQIAAFQEEARLTNKVRHPSIVSLLDFGMTDSGVPYMVLEHIAGTSVHELVDKNGPLDWQMARKVFLQICDALEHAHDMGVLHRDIKPSNMILEMDDNNITVRLIDFGIAAVQNGALSTANIAKGAGAPLFMSADIGLGRAYDVRSETYSLGCSFFYAIFGRPPYEGESAMQTMMLHAEQPLPELSELIASQNRASPIGLDGFIEKALAKNPEDRFQSVAEFRRALNSLVLAPEELVQQRSSVVFKENKTQANKALAVLGIMAMLAGIAIAYRTAASNRVSVKASAPPVAHEADESTIFETEGGKALESLTAQKWHADSDGDAAARVLGESQKSSRQGTIQRTYQGSEVSDEDFKELIDKVGLTGVEVSPMSAATGIGFRYLKNTPLETVEMLAPNFNDEGALEVSKIKTIKRLNISFTSKLTGKGLACLSGMPKLETLLLRNIRNLPPNTGRIVSSAESLRHFDLAFSKPISVEDISSVCKIGTLDILCLSETEIGDKHLAAICKRGIGSLEVDKTKITPSGLALLGQCPKLRYLRISPGNGITMDALQGFKKKHSDWEVRIVDPLDVIDVVKDFAL